VVFKKKSRERFPGPRGGVDPQTPRKTTPKLRNNRNAEQAACDLIAYGPIP